MDTGATTVDYDLDRVIGEDARLRMKEMQLRQKNKKEIVEENQTDGFHLSGLDVGRSQAKSGLTIENRVYSVMTDSQMIETRNKRATALDLINSHIKKRK